MNTYDDINIEDLIIRDIQTIDNNGNKSMREKALRKYYSNPNFCKCCEKMIVVEIGQSVASVKRKSFCSHACAATYNNKSRTDGKFGPTSILTNCSDDDFIHAYNHSSNYSQLGLAIGYAHINSETRNRIKSRIDSLGLEQYKTIYQLDISQATKGDLVNKRLNWQSWRGEIQKNARATYQRSSKPNYCIVCGYDKTYEVAHIKAVSDFDDDVLISEINNINNLIALCPNHHWEFDHGKLDLSEYIV